MTELNPFRKTAFRLVKKHYEDGWNMEGMIDDYEKDSALVASDYVEERGLDGQLLRDLAEACGEIQKEAAICVHLLALHVIPPHQPSVRIEVNDRYGWINREFSPVVTMELRLGIANPFGGGTVFRREFHADLEHVSSRWIATCLKSIYVEMATYVATQ